MRKLLRPIWHFYLALRTRLEGLMFLWRVRMSRDLKIVIGSSGQFEPGWMPSEYQYLNLLKPEHWRRSFGERKIDAILAEHVFEHLTLEEGQVALKTCAAFLRSGGYVRIAVPDGYNPDPAYITRVKPGGTGPGSDDHKVLYNFELLSKMMEEASLRPRALEYYSKNGQFHYTDWDPLSGKIYRSRRYDERNADGILRYTSVIVDGIKE